MPDIHDIAPTLKKADNGIWYSPEESSISYPADGNDSCFSVEDRSFWFKHRNACIAGMVSAFPPGDRGPIYDIGGGNGFVSLGLANAGFDVVLVEPGRAAQPMQKKEALPTSSAQPHKRPGLKRIHYLPLGCSMFLNTSKMTGHSSSLFTPC
jgi:hypothetical protein